MQGFGVLHVDPQVDFVSGSLAVPGAPEIIPVLNHITSLAKEKKLPIAMSADWHPATTTHFTQFGGPWPVHCVADTPGAAFDSRLDIMGVEVFHKGMSTHDDGYSPWEGISESGETLDAYFKRLGVHTLVIDGLATDYCVQAGVLDALKLGYKVIVVEDAVRAVNLHPEDGNKAIEEMKSAGAQFILSGQIVDKKYLHCLLF